MSDHIHILQRLNRDEIATLITSSFDSEYYLRSNPDVEASGWQAVDHYLQHGWREGRFPSPHFAACAHLFDGQDLQARDINPFALFLLMRATGAAGPDRAERDQPLHSHRIKAHADYAAALTGHPGWDDGPAHHPRHGTRGRLANSQRLQLNDHVDRPIVLLPANPWPGAMEIARLFNEQQAAFLHFGGSVAVDHWRTGLITVADLSSASATDAERLLIDAIRGIDAPLVIDLGGWTLRDVTPRQTAAFAERATRYIAFLPTAQIPATGSPDWVSVVRVVAEADDAQDRATVAPLTSSPDHLCAKVKDICAHAV